jgi:hypothetical protein
VAISLAVEWGVIAFNPFHIGSPVRAAILKLLAINSETIQQLKPPNVMGFILRLVRLFLYELMRLLLNLLVKR